LTGKLGDASRNCKRVVPPALCGDRPPTAGKRSFIRRSRGHRNSVAGNEGGARRCLALDDSDSDVHRILAATNVIQDRHDQAVYHQRRALSLNPNDDLVGVQQGEILIWLGQPEDGIEWIKKAMRLNPHQHHPERFWHHLARACFAARRYGEATEALGCVTSADAMHRATLAACHAHRGDAAAAEGQRRLALAPVPGFGIGEYLASLHYRDAADREHHRKGLELAGFPP
jgi:adenylate cyclase